RGLQRFEVVGDDQLAPHVGAATIAEAQGQGVARAAARQRRALARRPDRDAAGSALSAAWVAGPRGRALAKLDDARGQPDLADVLDREPDRLAVEGERAAEDVEQRVTNREQLVARRGLGRRIGLVAKPGEIAGDVEVAQ